MSNLYNRTLNAEDVDVGDVQRKIIEGIDREDFVRYAGASGDFTRFHYDEPHAKAIGNPSVFAPGMLVAGYADTLVSNWLGLRRIDTFGTRFRSRVWPGDDLVVTAEVVSMSESADGAITEVDISVTNRGEETVISGSATATLPWRDE